MATKKQKSPEEALADKAERQAKRKAKGKWKRLHTATKVIAVLCAAVGIAVGACAVLLLSRNDRFVLVGESHYTVALGEEYVYAEEGVEAYCFGRDVSGKLSVETALQKNAEGKYVIPTDKEGTYTIVYTVDCIKFGENAPNGQIRRIRTFTVIATEEDGIYE
ncbi:MAG: hypothetical protein IJA78_03455 [Clostridia bacterium]|nr:hypothetical protein [Clostridia bacterium]